MTRFSSKSAQSWKIAKNLPFGTLDHSKMHFEWSSMRGTTAQMLENIKFYHYKQYQVDPKDLSPKNGQKPTFWHFGSFKNAFLRLLNDPTWAISAPNCCQHLVLSRYAIWSPSDQPNPRNWPKTERIIQKFLCLLRKKTLKINKNFPGHAVFAVISGKVSIFI